MRATLLILLLFVCITSASAQSQFIDSLQNIVALQRHDTTELDALLNLANEFSRKDFEKAKTYAYHAIALARARQNNVKLSGGYGYMVTLHQNSGQLDSATYYLARLESLAKSNPSKVKIQSAFNQLAGLFYKNLGQYRKALPYMMDNLSLLIAENESRAGQLLNIGNTFHGMGDFKNAVSYHLQALSLFEKLTIKRGESFCLQSLGNDLLELKQFEQAKKYFQQSIKLKEELQDKRGIITASQGLGDVCRELGEYDIAEKYYRHAIQSSREMKLIVDESRNLLQLGLLYKRMGSLPQARENISQALKLARQGGDSTLSAKINSELIGLDFQEQKERRVEATLITNLYTQINSGDRKGESTEYSRLSEYYASRNQFDKAFYYLKKHAALKDSVEGKSILLQIKQLEEQYQSEKKEKEIALLKKDQELQTLALSRERTNNTLIGIALISVVLISLLLVNRYRVLHRTKHQIELERVRNTIARDLHDDIGSTLSSINIISKLAMNESNGNTKHHLEKIGEHSSKMMESMSDIVWSINPNNDSLEQVVVKMKEFTAEILEPRNITYTFQGEEVLNGTALDIHVRKNIFLIFKEAINNAAKYSEATQVNVQFKVNENILRLFITDNGTGFDFENIKPGNGLRNIRERAKSINATLDLRSSPMAGTQVVVDMPIT